jgi:transcriptional regulator
MHPAPAFAWEDEAAMRAFVADVAFAHVFIAGPHGTAVVHVPLLVVDAGLQFHLPRRNRATPLIEHATITASIAGPDAYVSPGWYAAADQVPTWNYVAVEAEGRVRRLDPPELVTHLDALSAEHERRLAPQPAWTRAKMTAGRFEAMLPAITGYELRVEQWRGTRKLSQNKPVADLQGVVAGMDGIGRTDMARLVADAGERRA